MINNEQNSVYSLFMQVKLERHLLLHFSPAL